MKVKINDKTYDLIDCITEEEKERGLSNVQSMNDDEGAFFDYREDPQTSLSFWMKDTTLPLDIIFVGEDDVVLSVKQGEPDSEELLTEPGVTYYVIELNQGSGVKEGDEVDLLTELEANKMYVLNPDGTAQFELQGGERIFSRISSRGIIKRAKKAYSTKTDNAYKALGKYVFNELDAQTSRDPEYVKSRK